MIFQIALALGNIVCKLANIVIIKMYDVTCKLKDPRFNKKIKTKFFIFSFLIIINHYLYWFFELLIYFLSFHSKTLV